ncbi:MAG: hypothetical protein H0T86_01220 [Gemmatimonadales bacterium]|nr:hypothetical protein [Gemmatimonadales bacterium]
MSGWRWAGGVLVSAAVVTACQERLTSPADCPALCPGGTVEVFDTIVPALQGRDSSFPAFQDRAFGYVDRGKGRALLVSNGFAPSEDRAVYRFLPRGDSITVRDTLRAYTVDSVVINLTLVARDTLVNGLTVFLYRLPSTVDSTATFDGIDPLLADPNLIGTIAVPDTVNTGAISTTIRGVDLAPVALPPGGDSVLAIGLRIAAETPTGIRVGSLGGSSAASFTSFVTVDVPDTGSARRQSLSRVTAFNTFVTQNPLVPDDTQLTVGGEPSSRALLRFGLSDELLDSITIVRATLELTPVRPIIGLPTDPTLLQTQAVIGDLGAKSPLTEDLLFMRLDTLATVQSDTVRLELTRFVQLWQSSRARPQSVFIRMPDQREAATFARAVFFSTRSSGAGASVAPRLRITYQRAFPFENP